MSITYNVPVDFQVFQELNYQRQSEDDTCNDVIRRYLKLSVNPKSSNSKDVGGKSWSSEGVDFPHGTEFRGKYKGKTYTARIENGVLLAEGKPARGLSNAVNVATGKGRNGWLFWECKRPGELTFTLVNTLRK
jgi:hypothetical protein